MEIEIAPIMFAYATFFSLVEIAGVFCLVRLLMMLLDKKRKVSLLSGAVLLLLMFIFLVFLVWGIYQQWRALGEDVGWTLFFGLFLIQPLAFLERAICRIRRCTYPMRERPLHSRFRC